MTARSWLRLSLANAQYGGIGALGGVALLGDPSHTATPRRCGLGRGPALATTSYGNTFDASSFLRKHPGKALFPWNLLKHLMVDGKLYPFEYGATTASREAGSSPRKFTARPQQGT